MRHPSPRAAVQGASFAAVTLALALTYLFPRPVAASDTQWWILDTPGDYVNSESHGVVVRPDGSLELGPQAVSTKIDSLSVVWSAVVLADGSLALAGDRGMILRRAPGGAIRVWARLGSGQVLALAADGDGVVAGTAPDGLVYRVSARGDTSLIARTGERYVWALAAAGRGAWWAATGTRGRMMRIEDGRVHIVADTDESNLVSILADGHGGVYSGGDSEGKLIHVTAGGTVSTVYDAAEEEIRALAWGPDGALYAAALATSGMTEQEKEGEPSPVKTPPTGARSVIYRIVPDSSAESWWTSPQPLVFALASLAEGRGAGPWRGLLAATGNRANVYLVDRSEGATQWLAAAEGQVTALAVGEKGEVFAATSNPAALWQLGPARSSRGELLSMALDARRYARFGRLFWQGDAAGGHVTLAARSGNTDPPDSTWSPWTDTDAAHGGAVRVPVARYLQWRITLAGGDPHIESVEAAWREQNQAPRVDNVLVAPQGQGFREGELQPHLEPITQTLPGGQRVEYSAPPTPGPSQLRDLPAWARGLRTVQWRASDANGDPLRFRLEVRSESGGPWVLVAKDLEQPAYTWDTSALPDGRYRLRVTASDAGGNAVGEELSGSAVSQPFTIDNTPPAVSALEARGERGAIVVSGRAEDAASPLQRIEVSIDDGRWRAVTPEGGFTDEKEHAFRVRVPEIAPGEHTVSIRVVDLAGNLSVRAVHASVPER